MEDGDTVPGWEYEERTLTRAEYEAQQAELESPATKLVMQSINALDLKVEMMGVL